MVRFLAPIFDHQKEENGVRSGALKNPVSFARTAKCTGSRRITVDIKKIITIRFKYVAALSVLRARFSECNNQVFMFLRVGYPVPAHVETLPAVEPIMRLCQGNLKVK